MNRANRDREDSWWGHTGNLRTFGSSKSASPDDLERAWSGLSRRLNVPARRIAIRTVAAVAAAAAVAGVVLAAGIRGRVTKHEATPPARQAAGHVDQLRRPKWTIPGHNASVAPAGRLQAAGESTVALTLGGRARATLAPGAEVFIPDGDAPLTVIGGAVDFEVARDPSAPVFRVLAGGTEIAAKGTAFNVSVEGDVVSVRVAEGVVEVSSRGATVTLRAGERWSSRAAVPAAGAPDNESAPSAPGRETCETTRSRPPKGAPPAEARQRADFESDRLAGILDAWHRHKDPALCLKLADSYLAEFPSGVLSQEVRYMRLLSLNALGRGRQFKDGLDEFRKLVPGSPYIKNLEPLSAERQ